MKPTWEEEWHRAKAAARRDAAVLSPGEKVWIASSPIPGLPPRRYAARVITHSPKKYREDRYLIELPDGRTLRVKRSEIWSAEDS